MTSRFIPIVQFPTSLVLIDDNKAFLENLSFELQQKYFVKAFQNVDLSISYLKQQDHLRDKLEDIIYSLEVGDSESEGESRPSLQDSILNILYSKERFQTVSTVLVDYLMPSQITGIELCQRIQEFPVRKIMLTGEADTNLAVEAFNDDMIDKFILKGVKNVVSQINTAIQEESSNYFEELTKLASGWNILQERSLQYAPVFFDVVKNKNIVEFYYMGDDSYLMLDSKANIFWLVFQNDEKINENDLLGRDNHADQLVLEKINARSQLLFLFSENEKKLPVQHWSDYLFPVTGKINDYYYSLIENHFFSLDMNKIVSYADCIREE